MAKEPGSIVGLDLAVIQRVYELLNNDGHGIYSEQSLVGCGVEVRIVRPFMKWWTVDGTLMEMSKQTPSKPTVYGVHGLEFLMAVVVGVGVPVVRCPSRRQTAYLVAKDLADWLRERGCVVVEPAPPQVLTSSPPSAY
jgi:hypothetical protein